MVITLIGFMGCGKSSTGKRLSDMLAVPFIDLDEFIVQQSGKTIEQLFDKGESHFREVEAECLKLAISKHHNLVLALGGGAIMTPSNAERIKASATCVYLKANLDTLESHLTQSYKRPLLNGYKLRDRISELMAKREATYEKAADITIITDGKSVIEVASEIAASI